MRIAFFTFGLLICLFTYGQRELLPKRPELLKVGEQAPNPRLVSETGDTFSLSAIRFKKASLIVFYRGGWCPYCNKHLKDLKTILKPLDSLGIRLIGISPDLPKNLRKTDKKHDLEFELYSDSKMKAADAFGISFYVEEGYRKRIKLIGMDIEKASGEYHHKLPIPSAFFIDDKGIARYVFSDPNYKERIDARELLKEIKLRISDGW